MEAWAELEIVPRGVVRHFYAKGRFYVMCWRAGYRVSTVRRLAREDAPQA